MSTEDNIKRLIGAADVETRAHEAEWNQFARKAHGALLMRRAGIALGAVALIAIGFFGAQKLTNDTMPELRPAPPATNGDASPEPAQTETTEPPETVEVPATEQELWFANGEKLAGGTTVMGGQLLADDPPDDPMAQRIAFWLETLLAGVPGPYAEAGDTTTIPEGTELLGIDFRGDALYVDLSSEFESGGGSLSMQMRIAQIVYTATQFEGVDAARITIEGEMVDTIGGEGIMVDRPLTRRDFEGFAPNIVVEEPRPGQEFSSGDVITGFANVFEANVSINVEDADGKTLVETFTTATCGSGCWGDFTQALDFKLDERQEGRINVLTYSAEDGSPQDQISIPVMLVP